jgi:HTH-type transcriptional regulator/antitoxin HigA
LEFKKQDLPKYSKAKLKKSLDKIKLLTLQKPKKALRELKLILNESGVALVYVTHFTNIRVSGAVRWIGDHPIIQLSTYYKWSDIFWFNLFHEIGHLLLHSKKEKFIEYDKSDNPILSDKEKEADEFAGNELIPCKKYLKFCEKDFSEKRIIVFARSLGIHPGIVAGRLCHDGKAEWNEMSDLRSKISDNDLS